MKRHGPGYFQGVLAALLLSLFAGAAVADGPPATAGAVDLQRYQGVWYELARLPMFFQRNCVQAEAHYALQTDGRMQVNNRCRTAQGEWIDAHGEAVVQVEGQTDKLWVRFDNWFSRLLPNVAKGDYWVLYLDENYSTALVGHPNRKYLWLLAREPQVAAETETVLLEQARLRGYDTGGLIWRAADTSAESPTQVSPSDADKTEAPDEPELEEPGELQTPANEPDVPLTPTP